MYLLYVDASGTPEAKDQSKNYVLLGLCVPEGHWFALNKLLNGLKDRYRYTGQDFELHAREFCVSIDEQGRIPGFDQMSWTDRRLRVQQYRQSRIDAETDPDRRAARIARYKRTEPFTHLTRAERTKLLEDALDLVGENDRIRLFGEAVSKDHPAIRSQTTNPVASAFEQVVSRFDAYLQTVDDRKLKTSPRRRIDNGLLVLDQDQSKERAIQALFESFRQTGHSWGQLRHVIDIPFFARSDLVCGLQLVDVCAYAVRRYLDSGAVPDSHEEVNFNRIFNKFDRSSAGRLRGLRHYVAAGSCHCLICKVRGHSF